MPTQCNRDLFGYEVVEGRQVVAAFDGGDHTTDAGALLLGATDRAIGLVVRFAACFADGRAQAQVEHTLSDRVSMCNFWANRLCCEAADRAMQVHGGMGYSRHKPFEHIYRHHRRYRITEGSEEIQKRKVAGFLFGYMGAGKH